MSPSWFSASSESPLAVVFGDTHCRREVSKLSRLDTRIPSLLRIELPVVVIPVVETYSDVAQAW